MPDYDIGAGSVLSYTYRSRLYGQTVMNTFYYMLDQTANLIGGAAFLGDFKAVMGGVGGLDTPYLNSIPGQVVAVEADVQWIYPDRYVKRTFTVAGGGLAGWAPNTANTAGVVLLRANQADKRSLAPKHIPGMGGTAVSAGLIQPAPFAALDDLGVTATLQQTVGTRIMYPIVFGRARPGYTDKHGVVHPPIPVSKRLVGAYVVEETARVMRRRTVGVGI